MKMKDVMETADVLIKLNEWRTGVDMKQPKPSKITKHLDRAVIMLCQYAEILDQRETNPISTNNDHVTFCNWSNSIKVPKDK